MAVKRWNGTAWEVYAGADVVPIKVTDGRPGKTTFIGATSPTGQVDGDIWIDQDTTTNAVVPTALTTKGDTFVATGNAAYTRLAAGNNGESLFADSSTSTGLRWQGDFNTGKNKILNGDFSIWQRGTTFNSIVNGSYSADRFQYTYNGNGTFNITRQAFTAGAAPVSGYESSYFLRSTCSVVGTSTVLDVAQKIEDVRTFSGQTVTVSFWAKADTSRTSYVWLIQQFGSGGSSDVYTGINSVAFNLTTSWQRFTFTGTMPSVADKTITSNSALLLLIRHSIAAGSQLDLWGIQVEAGSVATPFTTAASNPASELAACQRYYYRHVIGSMQPVSLAFYWSATQLQTTIPFPVTMRSAPTLDATSGTSYYRIGRNSTSQDINGFALSIASPQSADIYNNGQASGTAGWAGTLYTINASSYIGFAAEL
jgi:hypothetical protein